MRNIAILFLLLNYCFCFSQDKSVLVTDIRINLFDAGNKTDGEIIILNCFKNPKFINTLNDSIYKGLIKQLNINNINIDPKSLVFIKGLEKVPFNYKEVTNNVDYFIIIETSIGLTDVLKYEEYEIVTTIKVLNQKKKKLLKVIETAILPEDSEQIKTFKVNQKNFSDAFLKSLMKAISTIKITE